MRDKIVSFALYSMVLIVGSAGVILIELLPQYLFMLDLVYGNF